MIQAQFNTLKSILCIGAHADDIEIGCGGTLLKMLSMYDDITVNWVVLSGAGGPRADEARCAADKFLVGAADSNVIIKDFRDRFFPYDGESVKEFFFELQHQFQPDLIFTHRREDLHQDHSLIAELTWNTFRSQLIMEYEIPKYEGDLGTPNVFVPLDESMCQQKIETIVNTFRTQHTKPWFSKEIFWSLLRIRGLEAGSPSKFAEGLYCRKIMV